MSYEKVKSISIKEGKVFINCAPNNVRPLSYSREEYPYFSKILQEKGLKAVEVELLKAYESGTLQDGTNKYTEALKVLKYILNDEYKRFDWRSHNAKYGTEEHKQERELRESKEFEALLLKALEHPKSKDKYVISKPYGDKMVYGRYSRNKMKWSNDTAEATKFSYEQEAKNLISWFSYASDWEVINIKGGL